jgi:DNA-binding IclR family transcriptional regulator
MVVDPILSDLRDEFGEAAIMGVPANGTLVYLAFFPSIQVIMVRKRLVKTRPMHCSALGKATSGAR